jgi:hypothetical protein
MASRKKKKATGNLVFALIGLTIYLSFAFSEIVKVFLKFGGIILVIGGLGAAILFSLRRTHSSPTQSSISSRQVRSTPKRVSDPGLLEKEFENRFNKIPSQSTQITHNGRWT